MNVINRCENWSAATPAKPFTRKFSAAFLAIALHLILLMSILHNVRRADDLDIGRSAASLLTILPSSPPSPLQTKMSLSAVPLNLPLQQFNLPGRYRVTLPRTDADDPCKLSSAAPQEHPTIRCPELKKLPDRGPSLFIFPDAAHNRWLDAAPDEADSRRSQRMLDRLKDRFAPDPPETKESDYDRVPLVSHDAWQKQEAWNQQFLH